MATEKAPAFQFYPKDFLTDEIVGLMSYTERGIYITLLCKCWLEGSLPATVADLARLVGMPLLRFEKLWTGPLSRCFFLEDGRLKQKRLEIERTKQAEYRRRQSDKGKASGASRKATEPQPETNHGSTAVQPEPQPDVNRTPTLQSSSAISPLRKVTKADDGGSKRPIFTGQKLVVFEWQFDKCVRDLGEFADDFRLDQFWFDLDARALREHLVVPDRDNGEWLRSEVLKEARRRGLPLRIATAPQVGKQTTRLAAAMQNIMGEGR